MTKRKRSDHASARPRRPAPESRDDDDDVKQSEGEQPPPGTPEALPGPSSTETLLLKNQKDGEDFLREVELYFKDIDPTKHDIFLKLVVAQQQSALAHSCFICQVKELFRGHAVMLKFFNEVLDPRYKIFLKEDVPEIQDLAKLYVAKVKMRSSPSVYTTFMHILYLYKERALPSDGVDREVEVLFANSCDLLEEFDCLRPNRAAPVVQSALHPRHSALEVSELQREQQSERLQRMCEDVAKRKRKEKGQEVVTERKQPQSEWLQRMCEDVAKRKRKEKGKEVVTEREQPPPKRVSLRLDNASNARRSSRSKAEDRHPRKPTHTTPAKVTKGKGRSQSGSQSSEDAKYIGRAMCTPSYILKKSPENGDDNGEAIAEISSALAKLVPNEEREMVRNEEREVVRNDDADDSDDSDDSDYETNAKVSVHRSGLARSVLNEECVLARKWPDNAIRIPNSYEEALFKCEEKQYDVDMSITIYEVTMVSWMDYLLKLQEPNVEELPPIKEFLSPMHKTCIKMMYGDLTQGVMEKLIKNPGRGLHKLLNQLILELESVKSLKAKRTPKWMQVYKDNFELSLEHKSIHRKSKR